MIKNFNVWPSELFDWVEEYLLKSIKNKTLILPHRWQDFANICKNNEVILRDFFYIPNNYRIFYTYSATESMEIIIKNIVDNGITHIINWDFWNLFLGESVSLKKNTDFITNWWWNRVEIEDFDIKNDVIAITVNDTSTGIEYSPSEMKQIRKNHIDKYIIADATSSFWALNYDINSADCWLFSVQKNFWLPPWLWLLILNDRVIQKSLEMEMSWFDVWAHHKISNFLKFQETNHTPSTPNILLIDALWFVVNKLKESFWSIENLEKHTLEKAEYFYNNINIEPLYNCTSWKSKTTFVLKTTIEEYELIFKKLKEKWLSISPWYASHKTENIRIANFPVHGIKDFKKLLDIINK